MVVNWTRSVTEKLIALLKQKRELWDAGDPSYAILEHRQNARNDIRDALKEHLPGVTENDIKAKIQSIRSQLRKELRAIEASRCGRFDERGPKLWCFDLLQFLVPKWSIIEPPTLTDIENLQLPSKRENQSQVPSTKRAVAWSRTTTAKLLKLLEEKRELWDVTLEGYPDEAKRKAAYKSIRNSMKTYLPTVKIMDIRSRITTVKTQLRKEMWRIRKATGANKKPRLWCFNRMKFLWPVVNRNVWNVTNTSFEEAMNDFENSESTFLEEDRRRRETSIVWSRSATEKLIELYQDKRELWDNCHSSYKERKLTGDALKTIHREMLAYLSDITLNDIRYKLVSIRSQLRKELRAIEEQKRRGRSRWPKLWCFKRLEFLIPYTRISIGTGSLSPNPSNDENIASNFESVEDIPCTSTQTMPNNPSAVTLKVEQSCISPKQKTEVNMADHCRICLESIDAVPVSLPSSVQQFLERDLKFECLSIVDLRPGLPQNACPECYSNLVSFQRFHAKCRQANEFLKEKLDALTKEEMDEIIEYEELETEEDSASYSDLQSTKNFNENNKVEEFLHIEDQNDELAGTEEEFLMEYDQHEDNAEFIDENAADRCISNDAIPMEEVRYSMQLVSDQVDSDIEEDNIQYGNESVENCQLGSDSEDSPDERPFACKNCDKTFTQIKLLRSHELIHSNTRPYICHVCGNRFRQHSVFKTHLALHFGKTFECSECGKKFANNPQLKIHKRVHGSEYPFRCDFEGCNASYIRWALLRDHKLTHSNLRTVECELCSSTFHHRNALYSHMGKVHPTITYRCPECCKCITQPSGMRKHLQTAHSIALDDISQLKIVLAERPKRKRKVREDMNSKLQ